MSFRNIIVATSIPLFSLGCAQPASLNLPQNVVLPTQQLQPPQLCDSDKRLKAGQDDLNVLGYNKLPTGSQKTDDQSALFWAITAESDDRYADMLERAKASCPAETLSQWEAGTLANSGSYTFDQAIASNRKAAERDRDTSRTYVRWSNEEQTQRVLSAIGGTIVAAGAAAGAPTTTSGSSSRQPLYAADNAAGCYKISRNPARHINTCSSDIIISWKNSANSSCQTATGCSLTISANSQRSDDPGNLPTSLFGVTRCFESDWARGLCKL